MELENAKTLSNTDMAIGSMINAQNQAMQSAASNAGGAVNGFMGMNMAGSNMNANDLLKAKMAADQSRKEEPASPSAAAAGSWICPVCHSENTGKFCPNDGTPRPAERFCPNCGNKVSAGAKFCPSCGQKL